jgi:peptidoglycan/LPS O-acetylase OafA/YrhL
MDSFLYLPHFVLGAFCAKHFGTIREWLQEWPGWAKVIWIIGSVYLYELATLIPSSAGVRWMEFLLKLAAGLGSAGLIVGAGSFARLGSLLNRRAFQFLGHTSYSFYLLHMPFLLALAPLAYRMTGSYLCAWTAALVVSYGVALVLYKFCELPGITLGNRCSKWAAMWLLRLGSKPGHAFQSSGRPEAVKISAAAPQNPA